MVKNKLLKATLVCSILLYGVSTEKLVMAAESDPQMLAVESPETEDTILQVTESEEIQENQWNLDMISWPREKDMSEDQETYAKIKVAVLDSGVSYTTDIKLVDSVNLISGEEGVDSFYEDVSGHGTSVAGIIGAQDNGEGVTGVNPYVSLYSVKVLDDNNEGTVGRIIDGIEWCINHDINIINMSFGMETDSKALHRAVKKAHRAGILMIAAVGNDYGAAQYPASYPEVMAVGSVCVDGEIEQMQANNSEILAPGETVPTVGFLDDIALTNGTSMAAPHVTGAASIIWAEHPEKSAEFIRELLVKSTRKMQNQEDYAGVLDIQYAEEQFEAADSSENTTGTIEIPDNEQDVEGYEDVVHAFWKSDDHVAALDDYSGYKTGFTYMKKGLKQADVASIFKNYDDPTIHGAFHGLYNYLANSVYLTRIADQTYNESLQAALSRLVYPTKRTFSSEKPRETNLIYGEAVINKALNELGMQWMNILGEIPSQQNQAYFVFGLALHTEMDAYAHRAGVIQGNQWVKLNESTQYKGMKNDDKSICPKRWEVAKSVAYKMIDLYKPGKVSNYLAVNKSFFRKSDKKGTFYLESFDSYSSYTE